MTYLNNSDKIDECIQSFNKKIFRLKNVKNNKTVIYPITLLNGLHNEITGYHAKKKGKIIREPGFMEHAKSCLTLFNEVQSQNKPSFN